MLSKRQLGANGPLVTEIGLGCMGMVEFYETTTDQQALATIEKALECGITLFDTADMYGQGRSEELLGKVIAPQRDKVVISTKVGFVRPTKDVTQMSLSGTPAYIRKSCEASLKRLKTDYIDLYFLHRVDPLTPVEETIGEMKRLVEEGKVRFLGMSDTTPDLLQRAMSMHPIAAYQGEYSLWHRDPEADLLPLCKQLGISFMPYSPLGRGFLAGNIKSNNELESTDWRKGLPRFQEGNLQKNLQRLERVKDFAVQKGCTLAQLALAWLLAQDKTIVPIPGATTPEQINEDCGVSNVHLSREDLETINSIMPLGCAVGAAYPDTMQAK